MKTLYTYLLMIALYMWNYDKKACNYRSRTPTRNSFYVRLLFLIARFRRLSNALWPIFFIALIIRNKNHIISTKPFTCFCEDYV